jgi:hypothetical protein
MTVNNRLFDGSPRRSNDIPFPRVGIEVSISEATNIIEPVADSGGSIPICTIKNKSTETYLNVAKDGKSSFESERWWNQSNLSFGKTAETGDRWAIIPVGMVNTDEGKGLLGIKDDITVDEEQCTIS